MFLVFYFNMIICEGKFQDTVFAKFSTEKKKKENKQKTGSFFETHFSNTLTPHLAFKSHSEMAYDTL